MAVGLGVPLGWSQAHLQLEHIPGDGSRYVRPVVGLAVAGAIVVGGIVALSIAH